MRDSLCSQTDLIHPVLGHGGDGDDLDAHQTGVTHGETVGVTRPVQRVDVPGHLCYHTHHPVPLQHRREVMMIVGTHLQTAFEQINLHTCAGDIYI